MKTRVAIYATLLWLASAIVLVSSGSAQSGRAGQPPKATPSPTPQTASPKLPDPKTSFAVDCGVDEYRLMFPTSYEGSLRKKFADVNRVSHTMNVSLVQQLNKAGARGYRLTSIVTGEAGYRISLVPVAMVKFGEGRYEYQQFETTSDLFFETSSFEEKYAQLSKQGFRVIAHALLYISCGSTPPRDPRIEIPDLVEKCESKDLFLLERENGVEKPTQHVLVRSVPSWRGHSSVEMATQINEKLAEGFDPITILSKFEILLEQTEKNNELLTDKPEVQVVRSSLGLRDDAIVKKRVNELAKQGYRLALVNNEIALMYRRDDTVIPVSYIWLDTKRKDFEKRLLKLQESGAIYRMTYPDKNKLIFEQAAVADGERREYKVLKFEFQEAENAAEGRVQIDLTPASKETMKMLNSLAKEGFIVRDLFVSDKVSVLLERSLKDSTIPTKVQN